MLRNRALAANADALEDALKNVGKTDSGRKHVLAPACSTGSRTPSEEKHHEGE